MNTSAALPIDVLFSDRAGFATASCRSHDSFSFAPAPGPVAARCACRRRHERRCLPTPWVGNVRESQNVIFRAVTMVERKVIDADDLELARAANPAGEGRGTPRRSSRPSPHSKRSCSRAFTRASRPRAGSSNGSALPIQRSRGACGDTGSVEQDHPRSASEPAFGWLPHKIPSGR